MRLLTFSGMGLLLASALAPTVVCRANALGASQSSGDRIVRVVTVTQDVLEFGIHDLLEPTMERLDRAASLCTGHVQQLGGESPLANLMEVKA